MIYIHIPFCVKKCLYCDFYSITDSSLKKDYTKALTDEIFEKRGVVSDTVYIGGGTPTSLGEELFLIVEAVRENFKLTNDCEFTVEANPGTVDEALLSGLKKRGVNRISLGAQSFNDNELKALGRIHTAKDIFKSCEMICGAGFENFNLDLMLALPFQTKDSLSYSLDCIQKINPPHVSAYSLIVEEGTPFYDMELSLPDEDTEREMYYMAQERLKENNLLRYEISNFAKPGYESRHNSGYWTGKEYIGIGAGAHSYLNGVRFSNEADIARYILGKGRAFESIVESEKEQQLDRFLLGLRMTNGVEYAGEFPERVEPLIKKGLLKKENGRLFLTKRGTDVANLVFMEFLND